MKVAVICDNKEQYNSYMKSHNDCNQCEYIYVDNNNLPHGIELDDVVDLRELTRIIRARLKPEWLMKNTGFGGTNVKTSDN